MKKLYIAPNVNVLFVESGNILAGSPEATTTNRYENGLHTGGETWGTGTSTEESTFEKGQGENGGGNRSKGNSFWEDEW